MKKKFFLFLLAVLLLSIGGCSSNTNKEEATTVSSEKPSNIESTTEKTQDLEKNDSSVQKESTQSVVSSSENSSTENSDINSSVKEDANPLSAYTNEQIEYARIWLLLGPNQDIDELNVTKIPSGTAINPNDELSAEYPNDVIQLAGSRLVDGSITYKSHGNGTITVYDVPLRWESIIPENKNQENVSVYTQDFLDNAYEVSVEPGNPEKVKAFIGIENIK